MYSTLATDEGVALSTGRESVLLSRHCWVSFQSEKARISFTEGCSLLDAPRPHTTLWPQLSWAPYVLAVLLEVVAVTMKLHVLTDRSQQPHEYDVQMKAP